MIKLKYCLEPYSEANPLEKGGAMSAMQHPAPQAPEVLQLFAFSRATDLYVLLHDAQGLKLHCKGDYAYLCVEAIKLEKPLSWWKSLFQTKKAGNGSRPLSLAEIQSQVSGNGGYFGVTQKILGIMLPDKRVYLFEPKSEAKSGREEHGRNCRLTSR